MLKRFFDWNVRVANAIEDVLPEPFTDSLLHLHEMTLKELVNEGPDTRILDVGSGHMCPFAHHRDPELGCQIIGIDILPEQLVDNRDVDMAVAGDVCGGIPIRDGVVDVVSSRSVLEHLPDTEAFVKEMARVLRPGGVVAHVFPCRFAPFAVINSILPNRVTKKLIGYFFPEWQDECGFRVHYDHCFYPRMKTVFERNGFTVREIRLRYYQSIYFKVFIPIYLISLTYDLVVWKLGLERLACQMLLVATARGEPSQVPA